MAENTSNSAQAQTKEGLNQKLAFNPNIQEFIPKGSQLNFGFSGPQGLKAPQLVSGSNPAANDEGSNHTTTEVNELFKLKYQPITLNTKATNIKPFVPKGVFKLGGFVPPSQSTSTQPIPASNEVQIPNGSHKEEVKQESEPVKEEPKILPSENSFVPVVSATILKSEEKDHQQDQAKTFRYTIEEMLALREQNKTRPEGMVLPELQLRDNIQFKKKRAHKKSGEYDLRANPASKFDLLNENVMEIRNLLNKLSETNFDKISKKITNNFTYNAVLLKELSVPQNFNNQKIIYYKATTEKDYLELYVKLCTILFKKFRSTENYEMVMFILIGVELQEVIVEEVSECVLWN